MRVGREGGGRTLSEPMVAASCSPRSWRKGGKEGRREGRKGTMGWGVGGWRQKRGGRSGALGWLAGGACRVLSSGPPASQPQHASLRAAGAVPRRRPGRWTSAASRGPPPRTSFLDITYIEHLLSRPPTPQVTSFPDHHPHRTSPGTPGPGPGGRRGAGWPARAR